METDPEAAPGVSYATALLSVSRLGLPARWPQPLASVVSPTPPCEKRGFCLRNRRILAIIVGSFVLGHSVIVAGISAVVVMIVVGNQAVASGVLEIMVAIRLRNEIEGEAWMILSGVLTIAFGVILKLAPIAYSLVLIRIVGVFAIRFGSPVIFAAFRIKSFAKRLFA